MERTYSYIIKTLRLLIIAVFAVTLNSCGSDDDDDDDGPSDVSLVGNTYFSSEVSYNDYGEKQEYNKTIEFLSSTRCSVHSWGYDQDLGEKNRFDKTVTLTYSVSGKSVLIYGWQWGQGDPFELKIKGDHLTGGGLDFKKI